MVTPPVVSPAAVVFPLRVFPPVLTLAEKELFTELVLLTVRLDEVFWETVVVLLLPLPVLELVALTVTELLEAVLENVPTALSWVSRSRPMSTAPVDTMPTVVLLEAVLFPVFTVNDMELLVFEELLIFVVSLVVLVTLVVFVELNPVVLLLEVTVVLILAS
jgi:hypothetical protein